jgi:hypothetical protein
MSKKERAAQLTVQGATVSDIQSILGVPKAWTTRLTQDEEFIALLHAFKNPTGLEGVDPEEASLLEQHFGSREAVREKLADLSSTSLQKEAGVLADRYTQLEHRVIAALSTSISLSTDPRQLTGVLNVIAARHAAMAKMNAPTQLNVYAGGNSRVAIQLTLPEHAIGKDALQLSPNNEVIAIEGRSLSSMNAMEAGELIERHRVASGQPPSAFQPMGADPLDDFQSDQDSIEGYPDL